MVSTSSAISPSPTVLFAPSLPSIRRRLFCSIGTARSGRELPANSWRSSQWLYHCHEWVQNSYGIQKTKSWELLCFHNVFASKYLWNMIVHWYLLEVSISHLWYRFFLLLLSSVGVAWGCWSAEEKIGSQNHSIGWWNLQLNKHQIIQETCCEFGFRRFFWIPCCKSLSITITIWVLTNQFCLNRKSDGHL